MSRDDLDWRAARRRWEDGVAARVIARGMGVAPSSVTRRAATGHWRRLNVVDLGVSPPANRPLADATPATPLATSTPLRNTAAQHRRSKPRTPRNAAPPAVAQPARAGQPTVAELRADPELAWEYASRVDDELADRGVEPTGDPREVRFRGWGMW